VPALLKENHFTPEEALTMTWTPLLSSTFFDGVKADMLVAVGGILGLSLIVFGLAMLMRVTGR
jgi:hypothetical protein